VVEYTGGSIMFDRDKAIDELINNDMNTIQNDDGWYLSSLLRSGFKGYEYMTDDELMQELKERDISELFGECNG
jgi:hypothetical protein